MSAAPPPASSTPPCSTNTDSQYFTLYYHRGDAIVYSAGPMTYNILKNTLIQLQAEGLEPLATTSAGPNGNFTYAFPGLAGYLGQFGGGNPWPTGFGGAPGGGIDSSGNLYCPIPPSGSGGGGGTPTCPPGYTYDPGSELCIPDQMPPGPGGGGGGGGGGSGGGGGGNPPPTPPPPPPAPPPPPPGGDESAECCQLTATYLYEIAVFLQYLAQLVAAEDNSTGPTAITAAIAAFSTAMVNELTPLNATILKLETLLAELVGNPAPGNPDPVTCAQLTAQFDKLIAAINGGDVPVNPTPPVAPADFTPTPYTVKDALADVEATKDLMPFVGTQS